MQGWISWWAHWAQEHVECNVESCADMCLDAAPAGPRRWLASASAALAGSQRTRWQMVQNCQYYQLPPTFLLRVERAQQPWLKQRCRKKAMQDEVTIQGFFHYRAAWSKYSCSFFSPYLLQSITPYSWLNWWSVRAWNHQLGTHPADVTI